MGENGNFIIVDDRQMLGITNKTKKTLGKYINPNEIYHLKIHYAIRAN